MPASLDHLLVDRATISRLLETNSGPGRWTKEFVAIATTALFRSFAAGAKEVALGQQLRANVSHVGYVQSGQDVAKDDVIQTTLKEGVAITGEQFRVIAVLQPSLTHHQKLLLEFIAQAV